QSAFLQIYTDWRANQAHLSELGVEKNASAYTRMLWILGTIMALVVVVIALCWVGLRRVLINPLNANIAHIQQIAQGDLTQRIHTPVEDDYYRHGGLLAEVLRQLLC
ncbi:hypothetical protein AA0N74_23130, partial [Chromobacterium vaccinii]|uniref:hypothetical protein n=1 Tax=Chromobacterium vaccinii TaxID=1108595 RepID=UPI0031E4CCD9